MSFALLLCIGTTLCFAQDKPKGAAEREGSKRVALLRFYDKRHNEHVYTYGDGEPASWRQNPHMGREATIGIASLAKEPDTTRLFRAIRPDGRHYFYLQKPASAQNIRLEEFVIYVWTKPGDDRIPIHACVLPDSTDVYLDGDMAKVKDFTDETLKGIGVKRRIIPRLFYLYPPKADEKKPGEKK
jgi:hypothetical protein